MTVDRGDFERAIRVVHAMNEKTGLAAERIEALLMSAVRSMVEAGVVDESRLDAAIARRRARRDADRR